MYIQLILLSIYVTKNFAGTLVTPILPTLTESFGVDPIVGKLFLILPALTALPVLLIAGYLNKFFSKRRIIIAGLILYGISGIGSFFASSINLIMIFRGMTGIAAGLIFPYEAPIFSDYFSKNKRDKLLKNAAIITQLSAIITIIIAGVLIDIYWRLGFLVYLIAFIPAFFIYYKLLEPEKQNKKKKKYPYVFSVIFRPMVYKLAILYFVFMVLAFQYFLNISYFITSKDLGEATAVSFAQSFFFLAAIISNMLMLYVIHHSSNKMLFSLQMIFISQGFFTIGGTNVDIYGVYFGSFLIGLGFGSFYTTIIYLLNYHTSKLNRVNANSFILLGMFLAQLSSEGIMGILKTIFFLQNFSQIALFEGILFAIVAIYAFILYIRENKYSAVLKEK